MSEVTAKRATGHHGCGASAPAAKKRNVLLVGHAAGDTLFGAERSFLDLLAAIDPQQYDLFCVLPEENNAYLSSVARYTKNITVFPYRWWTSTRPYDEHAVSHFENVIRRYRPDVVHVNTIVLSDPLIAARRLHVPTIVHARELIDKDPALGDHFGCEPSAVVSSVRAADFIIANSEATYRLYYKRDRTFRLYNCVDVARFALTNNPEPGNLKVGIISSNIPNKGIEHFVKLAILAGQRRPHLEFLVIGPRTEHAVELERVAGAQESPVNLRFTGYVPDPVEALRQVNGRVDEDVTILIPHSPGCADFPLPVLHGRASLTVVYRWTIRAAGSGCRVRSAAKRLQRSRLPRSRRDSHFCQILAT